MSMIKTIGEETKEQLQEELKKAKAEFELNKWAAKKTTESMNFIITEIIQNKKDLQNKINEVEKMNKFMIDRELKMIELKKELSLEKSKNLQNQKAIDK